MIALLFSCDKGKVSPYYQVPKGFYFTFKDSNGIGRINKISDTLINMYYIENDTQKYVGDFNVFESPDSVKQYFWGTRDAALISSKNIKNFYLEKNGSIVASIFLDVEYIQSGDKSCMCLYPYRTVKYNSKVYSPEIAVGGYKAYVFIK